jgi:hypothetical protein
MPVRFALLLALVVTLGASSAAQQHSREFSLDLLTIPAPPERRGKASGWGCGSGGGAAHAHAKPSVHITLAELDQAHLTVGDEIVFEVVVENVSENSIELATSRDPDVAPPDPRSEDRVRTNFVLVSRTKGKYNGVVASGPGLYGSSQVPGTTMIVHPGERLRVRVPARVWTDPRLARPQRLKLTPMFWVQRGCRGVPLEAAANTRSVHLLPR